MLRALRKVKETSSISGQDAEDKKHLQEIRDATVALQKTFAAWYKSFNDFCTSTANVHRDIANLYPANQNLANSVMILNGSNDIFTSAQMAMNELKASVEAASNELVARTTDLISKANERAFARAEIEHYKIKVANLANEGLQDPKKQVKAESNQAKLADNQQIFRRLDDLLTTSLAQLDSEIAHLTSQPLETFLRIQTDFSHSLNTLYANAVAEGVKNASQTPPPVVTNTFHSAPADTVVAEPIKSDAPGDVSEAAETSPEDVGASSEEATTSPADVDAESGVDNANADAGVNAESEAAAPETAAEAVEAAEDEEPEVAVPELTENAAPAEGSGSSEPAEHVAGEDANVENMESGDNANNDESGESVPDGWSNHSGGNPFA